MYVFFSYYSYGLSNYTVSSSGYAATNDIMNNELERIWNEAIVA
jgi:hypothetical protein